VALVEQKCKIKLAAAACMKRYYDSWGFKLQNRPNKSNAKHYEPVMKWLDEEYPAIKQEAKAQNAEIHWGIETAFVKTKEGQNKKLLIMTKKILNNLYSYHLKNI
jgi:hypothetical protein